MEIWVLLRIYIHEGVSWLKALTNHANIFLTYSGKTYPMVSVQIIMNTRNVAKLNFNSWLEHFSVLWKLQSELLHVCVAVFM